MHRETDEVFILFKGDAILIEAKPQKNTISLYCERMKLGVTYNIPAGTWHNIAMNSDAEIIIVEKSNTHNARLCLPEIEPIGKGGFVFDD